MCCLHPHTFVGYAFPAFTFAMLDCGQGERPVANSVPLGIWSPLNLPCKQVLSDDAKEVSKAFANCVSAAAQSGPAQVVRESAVMLMVGGFLFFMAQGGCCAIHNPSLESI